MHASEIDRLLGAGRYADILQSRGAFVLVTTKDATTRIITSRDLGKQAYYTVLGGPLFWGHSVEEVVQTSKIPFEWNYEAIANYLIFDHVLDKETLHAGIFATRPGTIVSFDGFALDVQSPRPEEAASSRHPGFEIDELRDRVVDEWKSVPGLLCLTAGMDSRLLLATLLSAGIRPDVFIAGQDGSFDVQVASDIARTFGLNSLRCKIEAEDFVKHADAVTRASNGSLPVSHWPGSLIAAHAAGSRLLLGFGGEAIRSYYDDEGLGSLLRSALPAPGHAAARLLRLRIGAGNLIANDKLVAPALAAHLDAEVARQRTLRICRRYSGVGEALDGFYRTQYLANKAVLDLSVMSKFASWSAPLLASDWLNRAERTPRWKKLGSIFHRRAIARLAAELLDFPEELNPGRLMSKWPPKSYFTRAIPRITHFVDQGVYASPQVGELVRSAQSGLNDIVSPELLASLWLSRTGRMLALKLVALGLWRRTLNN